MMELDVQDGYIYVINELSLERYLANVVANAMPSDYPDAAMQAMAICARGTAYAKLRMKVTQNIMHILTIPAFVRYIIMWQRPMRRSVR